MTWSIPRQINLPDSVAAQSDAAGCHRAASRCHSGEAEVSDRRGVSVGP